MATKVQICNMALTDLGATTITTLEASDDSKEADACRVYYDLLILELLEEHPWDFAKTWVALAEDAGYTFVDDMYDYAYEKPADYVRHSRLEDKDVEFEVRGTNIVSNQEDLEIEYIKEMADPTVYPPHFVTALAARLRASLAMTLSRKGSKAVDWMGIYMHQVLPRAKLLDSQVSRPSRATQYEHTESADTWLSARSS